MREREGWQCLICVRSKAALPIAVSTYEGCGHHIGISFPTWMATITAFPSSTAAVAPSIEPEDLVRMCASEHTVRSGIGPDAVGRFRSTL